MTLRRACSAAVLAAVILPSVGCHTSRDWDCRVAVRALVNAKSPGETKAALEQVVALGSYAITEIEQELHAAPSEARSRLLEAVALIGDRAALPLVRFVSYWDAEPALRRQAASVAARLARR